jgi:hypothetical protein
MIAFRYLAQQFGEPFLITYICQVGFLTKPMESHIACVRLKRKAFTSTITNKQTNYLTVSADTALLEAFVEPLLTLLQLSTVTFYGPRPTRKKKNETVMTKYLREQIQAKFQAR